MNNFKSEGQSPKVKLIVGAVLIVVLLVVFSIVNPFSFNEAGYRTVVTKANGKQFVRFEAGIFYAGFFAKEQPWPNQLSVSSREAKADYDLSDGSIEIGFIPIRFNDATTARAAGITQYILPSTEKEMLAIHNTHKTPESLVQRRLGPYTIECLQNSSQLMSSEMHYGGGRAQMAQDYLDQLKNGAFLLSVQETNTYDSIEKVYKKLYAVAIQKDSAGANKRKFSSIKEYSIAVADAQITQVDYEDAVDKMLQKKIQAATDASVSRQQLMTAQQKQLTAEAQGKQKLVEIEYIQKQEQTKQVVVAETQVELAKQDLAKQEIARQAAEKEAAKIKTLADAKAYEKQRMMSADGALEKKLATYEKVQGMWADAFKGYTGAIVPSTIMGSSSYQGNAATQFMEIMGLKAAKDLSLDLKNK